MTVLLVLNAVVAAAGIIFAVLAAVRPAALSHSTAPTAGEHFYARMYAVRGVPLGLLVGILPLTSAGVATVALLLGAAAVQVADTVLGIARREWTMVGGGAVAAVVHVATAMVSG